MRKTALLSAAAVIVVALGVPAVAPATTASADTRLSEIDCNDFTSLPWEQRHHIYLTDEQPTVVEEFPEHPPQILCAQWEGSAPASYSISFFMAPLDHPDGATGTVSVGHGFGFTPAMPGYIYEVTFSVLP